VLWKVYGGENSGKSRSRNPPSSVYVSAMNNVAASFGKVNAAGRFAAWRWIFSSQRGAVL
jgi:hypothetical protein